MEDLNKNQLILLALLVSFVTSIATGIVTVALMEQAPQSVTQTINKVVTQTIEKVVTEKTPATVIRAYDDDLIPAAVEKNASGTVKIRLGQEGDVVGYGTVVAVDGIIVSDLNPSNFASEAKYYAVFPDAEVMPLTFVKFDKSGVSLFAATLGEGESAYKPKFIMLGDSERARVGQTVLVLSPSGTSLEKGIVSGVVRDTLATSTEATASSTPAASFIKLFRLSIPLSSENSGVPLINLDGDVIGITMYRGEGIKVAVPSNIVKESIAAWRSSKK